MSWPNAPASGWKSSLQQGNTMRCHMRYLAFVVALGFVSAVAADRDELMPHTYRDVPLHRPLPSAKPLHFQAPPSQLLQPWRCGGIDVYGRPAIDGRCPYDPHVAPDFLLDPYVTLRLMPPLRPEPPRFQPGEPRPNGPFNGAPPSQLPKTHPTNPFPIFER